MDRRFDKAAQELPGGFAGIFVENDQYVVLLKDMDRSAETEEGLREKRLLPRALRPVVFRTANWSFDELTQHYAIFLESIGELPGFAYSDIDESENQLRAGFTTQEYL